MFLTFVKNARNIGHNLLIYSWIIGMISSIFFMTLTQDVLLSLIIGVFMFLKWAFIGFLIQFIADMFLVERD